MRLDTSIVNDLAILPMPTHRRFQNLQNHTFGDLRVIGYAGTVRARTSWFCTCLCGTLCLFPATYLKRGRNTHCGCLDGFRSGGTLPRHGLSHTPTWECWSSMIERCRGYTADDQKYYVAKGVKVCERWQSFENFLADMGERPGLEYSVDRKDYNGDYTPENCRWATDTEQNRNRSNTKLLTIDGVTKPLTQWAEENGLMPQTIWRRLDRGLSGTTLIQPKHQGHEFTCSGSPCTCSSRRRFGVEEKFRNLMERKQGQRVTLRIISQRVGITQTEAARMCEARGLTIHPDPALNSYPRFGRQTVHCPTKPNID